MPGNMQRFLGNALLLENTYNGAWWYMFAYVVIIILSPILLKSVKKFPIGSLAIGVVIYIVAYYVRFNVQTDSWLITKFGPLGMTLFEYILGATCSKMQWFTKLYTRWRKVPSYLQVVILLVLMTGIFFGRTLLVPSLFFAPITGFIIISIFHFLRKPVVIKRIFLYIGKHSTNIWLIHMFFYAKLFDDFVYIAKYPIGIFLWMLIITLIVSNIIKKIENLLFKPFNITF